MIGNRRTERRRCRRKPVVYNGSRRGNVQDMITTDTIVLVKARTLDDLTELARLAADRLPETDPLVLALRGVIAQARTESVLED